MRHIIINKYHSGKTYQQVQHAHFGSRSSPIVVSHKKIKNFNSLQGILDNPSLLRRREKVTDLSDGSEI
jgi:hypothetical protein